MSNKNNKWVYWKEECDMCSNRTNCEYEENARKYRKDLAKVKSSNVYGTLKFNCDYFVLDEEKYDKENPGECCG